jgi:hypothetical protein
VETLTPVPGDTAVAYERDIAFDLLRRGLLLAPFAVALGALLGGRDAAVGVALGLAVVLFNYLVAGIAQSWAATTGSPGMLGGTVLASLIFRFVVVIGSLMAAKHASFLDLTSFGIAIVAGHLGLLVWEAKSVHLSLAFPGLKPGKD